jgi:DNA-binding Xre family transcriptional regulator
MIKIKIAELARKHDVTSAYQLQNFLGISPSIASRLWKGDFDKIGISTINKLCNRLVCQPSDFLEYVQLPQSKEDPIHDRYVTKAERAKGATRISRALGWGNPRSKKPKVEPQTDNILLNNSLFDNAQSKNTKSDITQMKHVPQSSNTESDKTQTDNEFSLTSAEVGLMLGLKPRTVREYAEKDLLKGKQGKQNHWFFRRVDVLEFKAQRDKE